MVNSRLVTAPRLRILKLAWSLAVSSSLLTYAYLVVWNWQVTLAVLWLPLLLLLVIEGFAVGRFAGPVDAREQAIIDGLRGRLRQLHAKQPGIKEITLTYPVHETVVKDGETTVKYRPGVYRSRSSSMEPSRTRNSPHGSVTKSPACSGAAGSICARSGSVKPAGRSPSGW